MANLEKIAQESEASQGHRELEWLLNKVDPIKPKIIVEIGVHLGHSLKVWQDAFKPDLLIGIDHETNDILKIYLLDTLRKVRFLQADSQDTQTLEQVKAILGDRKIDFLFIDGDHMYNGVKQDFEMYSPLVREGGIIAFDDMHLFTNPSVEVYRFWGQVQEQWPASTEWLKDDSNGIGVLHT